MSKIVKAVAMFEAYNSAVFSILEDAGVGEDVLDQITEHANKIKNDIAELETGKVNKTVYLLTDKEPEAKMPMQMRQLYDVLKDLSGEERETVTFASWCNAAGKVLQTKQPVERVVGYYRPHLISAGLIRQLAA